MSFDAASGPYHSKRINIESTAYQRLKSWALENGIYGSPQAAHEDGFSEAILQLIEYQNDEN